jgi:hypothetical protein
MNGSDGNAGAGTLEPDVRLAAVSAGLELAKAIRRAGELLLAPEPGPDADGKFRAFGVNTLMYGAPETEIHHQFFGVGLNVIRSPHVNVVERVQVRFPRSKRARIRKKWAKRPCNWRTMEKEQAFMFPGGNLVCSPGLVEKLQRAMRDRIDVMAIGAMVGEKPNAANQAEAGRR